MRNGGSVVMTIDYSNLLPAPAAPADPALVEVKLKAPDGSTVTTAAWPGTVVRDSVGVFHWNSPALDFVRGGVYKFLAKAAGYPEVRLELTVEPSAW